MQQLLVKWVGKSRGRETRESKISLAQPERKGNTHFIWKYRIRCAWGQPPSDPRMVGSRQLWRNPARVLIAIFCCCLRPVTGLPSPMCPSSWAG